MKCLLSIFLFLTGTLPANAQFRVDSTRFITGLRCCVTFNFSIPTSDKGILIVGMEEFDNGGIIPYFGLDTQSENVFVCKIDSEQHIQWIKIHGGHHDDIGEAVCETPDGGFAVIATTTSVDSEVTHPTPGVEDIWLLRLDANGNMLWQHAYGAVTGGVGAAMSIANTPDGGFIFFGACNGSGDDAPSHYGSWTNDDWLIIKTDSAGNRQWSQNYGGTDNEALIMSGYGNCGSVFPVGNKYFLASSTYSRDYNCTDTCWHPGVNTGADYYLLCMDSLGNLLWDSSYGGSSDDIVTYAYFDTRDSTIMVVGFTQSNDYMVTGFVGGGDTWLLKLGLDGHLIWQKTIGIAGDQEPATSMCKGPNGGYICYGPRGLGVNQVAWIAQLDTFGYLITDTTFGGVGFEEPASVVPYHGGFVATGISTADSFSMGTSYGDFSPGGGAYVSYINLSPLSVKNTNIDENSLTLFPNPSSTAITVKSNCTTIGSMRIINVLGKEMYKINIDAGIQNITINTNNWSLGLYLLQWKGNDGKTLTTKFTKY